VLIVLFCVLVFMQAVAFFWRSYLEWVEGEESAGKYLDKDKMGDEAEDLEHAHPFGLDLKRTNNNLTTRGRATGGRHMLFGLDGVEVGLIIVFLTLFAGIMTGFPVAFAIGGAGVISFAIIAALDSAAC
jgi:hypothetical protein